MKVSWQEAARIASAWLAIPASFDALWQMYEEPIRRWCRRQGLADHDLDDLVQDIALALLRRNVIGRFNPAAGTFNTWIWGHVRRDVADYKRKRARQVNHETRIWDENAPELLVHADAGFTNVECEDALMSTYEQLEALPPGKRKWAPKLFGDVISDLADADFREPISYKGLAKKRGVKPPTVFEQVNRLRRLPAIQWLKNDLLHL
jgi:RNA polymerase sigma factor (sigma-70 family)